MRDLPENLRAVTAVAQVLIHCKKQNVRNISKRQRRIKSAEYCFIIAGDQFTFSGTHQNKKFQLAQQAKKLKSELENLKNG